MKEYRYTVSGEETITRFVETDEDFDAFIEWSESNGGVVFGLDTETTGLNIYSAEFRCRLVQIGIPREAFVIPAERFHERLVPWFEESVAVGQKFVAHNAAFDLLVLDRSGLADLDGLGPLTFDTQILAHLLDPRSKQEGGTGLALKPLSEIYVDSAAPDTAEGLYTIFRKEYACTKKSGLGWARIDIDHPTYVLYAGLDVILVTRLLKELTILIRGNDLGRLAQFEHRVMLSGARMRRRGMLLDVDYTSGLVDSLTAEHEAQVARAASYGVANVNAPRQVVDGLLGTGEVWDDRTASGALSSGKEVLLPMADLDKDWQRIGLREPNPLADAVLRAKRALKWRASYAQAMLSDRDPDNRIHPNINTLAARTARMSVSNPPLQQLPAGDATIRRALIADPGKVIIAADYAQVEMRVLGALGNVKGIKDAVAAGQSIHEYTASLLWPNGYEKWQYKVAKNTGFCKVYGGGVSKVAQTSGVDFETAREVVNAYDRAFPEIVEFGRRLQREAARRGGVVITPFGRHLPLDRDRAYAATNYLVQSTARDIMARAILQVEEAGLGDYVLLPVHDELICQAPTDEAEEVIHAIARVMECEFQGVSIEADASVYGHSWGHGYGATA